MSEAEKLAAAEAQKQFDDMQPQAITDVEIIDLFVAFKMQRVMDIQQQEGKKKKKNQIENDPENIRLFCDHLLDNYFERLGALNKQLQETKDMKFDFGEIEKEDHNVEFPNLIGNANLT